MAIKALFSRKAGQPADGFGASDEQKGLRPIDKRDAERRLALLDSFEESGIGWFWATDGLGRLIYLSEHAIHQIGLEHGTLMGKGVATLFSTDPLDEAEDKRRPLGFLLSARNTIADLPVRVAIDDREVWWSITGKPQFDAQGEFLGYRGSAKDISAEIVRQRDAARLAQYDSLTGLSNRHRMTSRLTATLTAYRSAKRSCALLMMDLDRFKHVNDTLGHPAGDELLRQVAQRLQTIVGKRGEIGRLGGDEFQVILPDMDDRGQLGELAGRLIQMVSQPYSVEGSRAIIGASVGIAIAPYDGLETDDLVSSADLALYAAKGGGRGQFRFYSAELKDGARLRKQIEEDLRDALHRDEMSLRFQPIVRASDGLVTCFEALLDWHHPDRGRIRPDLFIPIAEETSIINDLGEWAMRKACSCASEWPGDLRVAVNVSAIQFTTSDVPAMVQRALAATGLDPARLEIELTESVFMGDQQSVQDTFLRLKKIGVRLALDDFGTGYSSLSYLRHAPFDKIKIDRSFVRGAAERGNNNPAIIKAIVSLAEALNMETVSEGVEAMDELELVTRLGTSHVQGYIYSQPTAHENVLERLARGELLYDAVGPAYHRADRRSTYRKVGVIHEDHRYDAVMRNLSRTGARIEGLLNVPLGTPLVVDFGEGQLAVATVRRSEGHVQGLEFETPLVSDGADGLCTRHRVSPYSLAAAGMPLAALPPGYYPLVQSASDADSKSRPAFMQVDLSHQGMRSA
ncbi:MAG: GGDEF domain-containing protein [Erythrobacter sp. 34-65-8]|nr:MAG: GGDEF domain-containing protein [Erythrobacter sp. 34-65-8]